MVKLHFINQKACLINWVLQFYLYQILFSIIYGFHFFFFFFFFFFLDSILMVPLNFNNQKHLQLIDFMLKKNIFSFFLEIRHIYIFLLNKFW